MLTLGLVVRKVSRAFSDDIATSQLYVFTPTMCVDQTTTWTYSSAKHFAFLTSPHHCGLDVAASERANVDGCPTRRVLQSVTADVSSDGIDVPSTYRTDGQAYVRHDPPHVTPFCSQGLMTSNSGSSGLPEITPSRRE